MRAMASANRWAGGDAFMRHSFKVMHDELHTVKIRISGALAPFAPLRTHQDQPRPKRRTHAG